MAYDLSNQILGWYKAVHALAELSQRKNENKFPLCNSPARRHDEYLPAYEDGTECSETLACKIQTPGNYTEENTQHSEHGESLKSRKFPLGICLKDTSLDMPSASPTKDILQLSA